MAKSSTRRNRAKSTGTAVGIVDAKAVLQQQSRTPSPRSWTLGDKRKEASRNGCKRYDRENA